MPTRPPTAAAIRRARERSDAGVSPGEIAGDFGVTVATFRRWRLAWGWPPRRTSRDRSVAEVATAPAAAGEDGPRRPTRAMLDDFTTPELVTAVRRAVGAELIRLTEGDPPPGTSEARARALASLTRTLGILRALEEQIAGLGENPPAHDDPPPIDIAELRQELARRLDRLCADRHDP